MFSSNEMLVKYKVNSVLPIYKLLPLLSEIILRNHALGYWKINFIF